MKFNTKVLDMNSGENIKKFGEIIGNLEKNLQLLIKNINDYIINSDSDKFHQTNYNTIENYLYNSNINFENDNFNNQELVKEIKKTFENYIEKIVLFKLEKISYNITEIYKCDYLKNFLSKDHKILEKYN